MKKVKNTIISLVLCIALFMGTIPFATNTTAQTSGLKTLCTVDSYGGINETQVLPYNSVKAGTAVRVSSIEGYVSDYFNNAGKALPVIRMQTTQGVGRALIVESKSYKTKFTTPVRPEMELHIDYKYVPAENTTTDVAQLLTKKPGIILRDPKVNNEAILEAKETLVSGEWATAVFDIGQFFDVSNEVLFNQFRYAPLSFSASGAATGTKLYNEAQTAVNVDSNDYVDIGNITFKIKTHTVSFDLNGGKSNGSTSADDYVYEGSMEYPEAPEKAGCVFEGWSLSQSSNATIDTSVWAPNSNCTLYAQYGEKNIVDLKSVNGSDAVKQLFSDGGGQVSGTFTTGVVDGFSSTIIHSNEASTRCIRTDHWDFKDKFTMPIRSGMRLALTYKYIQAEDSDSSSSITQQHPTMRIACIDDTQTTKAETITANETVVVGEWAKAYFDLSKLASETQNYYIKQIHIMPLGEAAAGAPEGTKLYSSNLSGVHVDSDDTIYIGAVTLALKYDYKITFDANGGGSGDKNEYLTAVGGGAKFDGQKPIRVGYEFIGWATSPTATENDVLAAGYMPTSDVTLYAVWKEDLTSTLESLAVVYPLSGERSTLVAGQKVFSDSDAVINNTVPSYLNSKEFNLDSASTAEKTLWIIDQGYIYIMTPKKGLEGSDAENLETLGFDAIGEYELISGTPYSIYGMFYSGKGTADSKIVVGANTVVIADLAYPDDSLKAPTIIRDIEENLEEHPEYSQFLDENRKFGGCPSITQTKDGAVWLSVTSGGTGEDMYNYAALYKSTDGGRTFGDFVIVADPDTPVRTSEPYVWCAPDGELFFWWSQMFVVPKGSNSDGRMGIFMMRSKDNGNTWTEPKRICDGFANQNPIVLSDGNYALPVNIWNNNSAHSDLNNKKCPTLYISTDKGENWSYVGGANDSNSGCSSSFFYENSVIEYNDGTLAMYYRTTAGKVGVITSTNGGETWSAEQDSEISYTSGRTAATRLKDGTTLFVSHNEELAQGNRTHLAVWLGKMDTEKGIIVKDDNYMLQLDYERGFYPSIYEGNDGFLYIAYDKARTPGGCAMIAKITLEDIKAGKLVTEGSFLRHLAFMGGYEELPSVTVSFDTKGGKSIKPLEFRTKNEDHTVPYEVRALPEAEKKGSKFLGWATEDGGEVVYNALDNYTPATLSNQTLYAVYAEKNTVNYYVKNGGTGNGKTEDTPAATVKDVLETIVNVDKLDADYVANIYIMQRDDWNTVDTANGLYNYITAWSVKDVKTLTAHECEIVVQAYDSNTTTYLTFIENLYGNNQSIQLAGPTTFKNIVLVSCSGENAGIVSNGNNLKIGAGTKLTRLTYKNDVLSIELNFPGRIITLDNNGIAGHNRTYTNPQKIVIENEIKAQTNRGMYISGASKTNATFKEDVTIIFNNSALIRDINWGSEYSEASTTFEKNLNINIKSAKEIRNMVKSSSVTVKGALQFIYNSNVTLTNEISTLTNLTVEKGKWIIKNQTEQNDLIDFTSTAGEFAVNSNANIVAVSNTGAVYYPNAFGYLKIPEGEYTVKVVSGNDLNADGDIDVRELVIIDQLVTNKVTYCPPADMDANGVIEKADIAKFRKYLFGL